MSPTVGELYKVFCTEEIKEASRCRLGRTQTPRPAELEVEAEAEVDELRDVKEIRKKPKIACSTRWRKISGGISECSRNLPGRDKAESKTASAGEDPESSLGEAWRPSITRGK